MFSHDYLQLLLFLLSDACNFQHNVNFLTIVFSSKAMNTGKSFSLKLLKIFVSESNRDPETDLKLLSAILAKKLKFEQICYNEAVTMSLKCV